MGTDQRTRERTEVDQTKGERTRAAVLLAAIDRFGRDGFRSTSVADIARDAGVGGTVPYAYFANKEDLFVSALDHDAGGVIDAGVSHVAQHGAGNAWRQTIMATLVAAVAEHPLAQRVLSGLEPGVTDRMIDLPALAELRRAIADRLAAEQAAGLARTDVDPVAMANATVAILISLLMAVLQFGTGGIDAYGSDVVALFDAALGRQP